MLSEAKGERWEWRTRDKGEKRRKRLPGQGELWGGGPQGPVLLTCPGSEGSSPGRPPIDAGRCPADLTGSGGVRGEQRSLWLPRDLKMLLLLALPRSVHWA